LFNIKKKASERDSFYSSSLLFSADRAPELQHPSGALPFETAMVRNCMSHPFQNPLQQGGVPPLQPPGLPRLSRADRPPLRLAADPPFRGLQTSSREMERMPSLPARHSAYGATEGTGTATTTRNPRLLFVFDGLLLLRLATRQLEASLFQLPPRFTRFEPVDCTRHVSSPPVGTRLTGHG
jgi:hypothetical protein